MNKVLNILSILFGLWFINAGLNKVFNYIPVPEDMPQSMIDLNEHMEALIWLLPLVAIVEIAGGILVLLKRTRALGAIVLFPVLVGILLVHIISAPSGLVIALIFWAIEIWILYKNWDKYKAMINA
ncbi:MAG: DoxX family protein [Flavobacteriales bacterium]|nr:DoxX family protein [Flavobacteriales bacterium]|tara:strand:+ start:588 stop:965 length:378 start_codon:yes stop_codon:yes gene_type:complete